jgi:hypothetical protein
MSTQSDQAHLRLDDWERWSLGAAATLYNPIVPIRLGDKGLWIIANVATLALFWIVVARRSADEESPRTPSNTA